jgi:GR25 family glycosyltransferase involved in LPS biosynthesis
MKFIYLLILFIIILFILTNTYSKFNNTELFTDADFNVYVINLKKNTERLDSFMNEYNKSDLKNMPLIVYPAVVGKELDLINYVTPAAYKQILTTEVLKNRRFHYELTRGAVGCYLSHLNIWKNIAESDKKFGLIFEDDVMIATDFYARLQVGLSHVPNDWDIYTCGIMCLKCDIKSNYISVNRFWGLHGYIVRKESATIIYNELNKLINKQIDAELSLLIKYGKIKIYGINPIIVAQNGNFGSDIQVPVDKNSDLDAFTEEFNQNQLSVFTNNYKN